MAAYIAQADLEARYSPAHVRRVFADDGSALPGTRLALACEAASREADAILGTAWPNLEARQALIENDEGVRGCVCVIAFALGYQGRPEHMLADGSFPYDKPANTARKFLERVAAAELRPRSEATAGANPTYAERVTTTDPERIFAPSAGKRPAGGF